MADNAVSSDVPVSDKALRELARNVAKVLPNFAEKEPSLGVKELYEILSPVLETADLADLESIHRAAASNALCAIIEHCHASPTEYVRLAILEDVIWGRLFNIYLERSDDAKGKSMRQMMMVLASVISRDDSPRKIELRKRAATSFLDIICKRQDRIKVKPALQGLAHFLLKDVIKIEHLVIIYNELLERPLGEQDVIAGLQEVFKSFLGWVVHHDTALSAGHLVKNFLLQAHRLSEYSAQSEGSPLLPLWVVPVVQTLRDWSDRTQEFKTHVFPHCFLPNINEYMYFLSYLHFDEHVKPKGKLPEQLCVFESLRNGLDKLEEFKVLLAAIATGKELTILRDNDYRLCNSVEIRDGAIHLPDDILGNWMSHPEPEVRLAGMFLSVYSTSVTKPMTGGIFKSLKRNLVHLHTDSDANYRREIQGYTQKLFDRLRASTATLMKAKTKVGTSSAHRLPFPADPSLSRSLQQDPLAEALSFVVWYIRFLEWEMRPTASYQRRVTALRSLTVVLRSGVDPGIPHLHLSKSAQGQLNWAHALQITSPKLIRLLFDLISDPFDDIRDAAVSVLQLCFTALPQNQKHLVLDIIPRFMSRAETTMLQTGRADQADGVARAYGLIFSVAGNDAATGDSQFSTKVGVFQHLKAQLDSTLSVAHTNLSEAVNGRPVHGTFAALRYIIDQPDFYSIVSGASGKRFDDWKQLHKDIVSSIESLWACVYHVLCADAPEGHVPDELEDEASLDTKEILSYSWRGLKEASVLLRTIISKAPTGTSDSDFITPELFQSLGRLCFTQLIELRHRGAFSTVSQTFAAFCRRCVSSNDPALRGLPEIWYQETLKSIQDKADAITRRSAGIPALMSGIMAAEPHPSSKLFPRAMKELIEIASTPAQSTNIEESRLPQVHALNCIKEIFTTSRLSVASEAYTGQGLELAAKTLNSNIWPIRNCSLMLFKALIERLLGSDEAQDWKERDRAKTSRFSYDNYPDLIKILTDLLDPNGPLKQSIEHKPDSSSPLDLHGAEGVFPGLQILRQARPPEAEIGPLLASVEKLLASPHWHLRDMAARTVVSLRPLPQLYSASLSLLAKVPTSHNTQHGTLLAVKYMLRKLLQETSGLALRDFTSLLKELTKSAEQWYAPSDCPFVRSAFLDIISLCGMTLLQRPDSGSILQIWEDLVASVSLGPQYALDISKGEGDALLRQSLAQAFFIDRLIYRNTESETNEPQDQQSLGEALMLLATEDADTCSTALETIEAVIQLKQSNESRVPLPSVLSSIHAIIISSRDAEVLSKAQSVLAEALISPNLRSAFFALPSKFQIFSTLTHLEAQCLNAPPSNMQSALHLLGFFLDHAHATYPEEPTSTSQAIARYIRLLRMTIIDTNPFDTRVAAIHSLRALSSIWAADTTHKPSAALLLGLSLLLHDLLNDDDDEIRNHAAAAVSTLLHAQNYIHAPTVPVLAEHHLAQFLCTRLASPALVAAGLRTLTCTPSSAALFSVPFADAFKQARRPDTALFATEKQNLYADAATDALLWRRAVLSMAAGSVHLFSAKLRTELHAWVLAGLETLGSHANSDAESNTDGPLGYSSSPAVFPLGLHLFCAADVCLSLPLTITEKAALLTALQRFADAGAATDVHALWREAVDKVLERQVLGMLGRVEGGMAEAGRAFEEFVYEGL